MTDPAPARVTGLPRRPASKARVQVSVVQAGSRPTRRTDYVATEEPLEIRLVAAGVTRTVAVTMRTPGSDFELAAGFLYGEGIVGAREQIRQITYCADPARDPAQLYNIVNVELTGSAPPELRGLERHFYTSSACGVCGKAGLDALELRGCSPLPPGPPIDAGVLYRLPPRLREGQGLFEATGGLHAAALFTPAGDLLGLREDVGRHNAVDKLVGWALLDGQLPLADRILMVSGRSSFEILQKALAAAIPFVCSVSAPSSLAVDLARRFGITLVGFLRGDRFNVYSGDARVRTDDAPTQSHQSAGKPTSPRRSVHGQRA